MATGYTDFATKGLRSPIRAESSAIAGTPTLPCPHYHLASKSLVLLLAILFAPVCLKTALAKIPNGSLSTAVPFETYGASIAGEIEDDADIAYYTFTLNYAHEVTVWLQTESIGSPLMAVVALYDPNGKLIAYNDSEFNLKRWAYEGDPILYLWLQPGKYYVGVATKAKWHALNYYPSGVPSATGAFQVNYLVTFDGPAIGDGYEPNDSRAAASAITLPFESGIANLLYFGDIDWFKFDGKKGTKLSISINELAANIMGGTEPRVKPRLGVFDGAGKLLQWSLGTLDPVTGYAADPSIVFTVPYDGKYYLGVTSPGDSGFVTAFNNVEFLKNPHVGSLAHDLGYYQLKVREAYDLYFAHIANGNFGETKFTTSMILLNTSSQRASGELKLYKSDGTPMVTEFPGTSSPANSYQFEIAPGGASVIATDGKNEGTAGYAVIHTTSPIKGTAVFSQFGSTGSLVTEAAVEASAGLEFFAFPVDNSGDFNTGLAVANINSSTKANLTMKLVDLEGRTLSSKSLTLDPGNQKAIFVGGAGQLFPELPGVRGSLQVVSDQPVYAIALRSTPVTLTTLMPVAMDLSYQAIKMRFPQVVIGGTNNNYRTTVLLTDPGYFAVSGTIRFTRADGSPMLVSINSRTSDTHAFSIPAHGTRILLTDLTDQLVSGYAILDADHEIGGMVVYSQYEGKTGRLLTEVAVSAAGAYSRAATFAQNEGVYTTGLAFVNLNANSAAITCRIQSGKDPADIQQVSLPPLDAAKQRAQMIAGPAQIFPDFSGSGTLTLDSTQPLYTVALRITATTMTALPVIPLP
jgi:hypothetical protein